jgi:hypothetical protein
MGQSLAAGHLDFTAVLFGEDMHMVELRKRQLMTQDGLVAERSFSIVHIAQRYIYRTSSKVCVSFSLQRMCLKQPRRFVPSPSHLLPSYPICEFNVTKEMHEQIQI